MGMNNTQKFASRPGSIATTTPEGTVIVTQQRGTRMFAGQVYWGDFLVTEVTCLMTRSRRDVLRSGRRPPGPKGRREARSEGRPMTRRVVKVKVLERLSATEVRVTASSGDDRNGATEVSYVAGYSDVPPAIDQRIVITIDAQDR